jgi:predicted GH43/DUF377 family glycosyl hydrolase
MSASSTSSVPFAMERLGVLMRADPRIPEEVEGVLNPGAIRGPDGELYLFPRIVGKGNYSRVGIGRVVFDRNGDPSGVERQGCVLEPEEPYELVEEGNGGCEDPRVTYLEPLGIYVMAYAALGQHGPRVAVAVSEDLRSWRRLGLVDFEPDPDPVYGVVFDEYHNKDAAYFPRTVTAPDGRAALAAIHRPVYGNDVPERIEDPRPSIWISYCALDDVRRDIRQLGHLRQHCVLIDPEAEWEDLRIGGGTPPVLTPHGWLLLYHGAAGRIEPGRPKDVRYCAGALVVDERDPRRVRYRSKRPVLEPETKEETRGVVSNVVFPTAIDDRGDGRIDVYYGMADESIGAARLRVPAKLPS